MVAPTVPPAYIPGWLWHCPTWWVATNGKQSKLPMMFVTESPGWWLAAGHVATESCMIINTIGVVNLVTTSVNHFVRFHCFHLIIMLTRFTGDFFQNFFKIWIHENHFAVYYTLLQCDFFKKIGCNQFHVLNNVPIINVHPKSNFHTLSWIK